MISDVSTERFNESTESKPNWMIEFDEYFENDEIEFDFETFFSKLTNAEVISSCDDYDSNVWHLRVLFYSFPIKMRAVK